MRFLYLDDSGKAHPNDPGTAVVFAGMSIDEDDVARVNRQIQGAKFRFFPDRGAPTSWEMKSIDFMSRDNWNRKKKREFVLEVFDIVRRNHGVIYCAEADKRQASHPVSEAWLAPKLIQVLAAKFHGEILIKQTTGTIVCDWSQYQMDEHIALCLNSLVVSKGMAEIRGSITYGSSIANECIQVADLVAACFRRTLEGQQHLQTLRTTLDALKLDRPDKRDIHGFPLHTVVRLF